MNGRLEAVGEGLRATLEARNRVREETLGLSRSIIRTAANSIRTAHRGELEPAAQMLAGAAGALRRIREQAVGFADIYGAGYVHDCQKEFAEASIFIALAGGGDLPDPDALQVEAAAYLNGMGEAVGERRRHVLDTMRQGDLSRAETLLAAMDEIYYLLVTFDYPDALTGGLRRTTDSVRGIIEKTRGELTTALGHEELRSALHATLSELRGNDETDAR